MICSYMCAPASDRFSLFDFQCSISDFGGSHVGGVVGGFKRSETTVTVILVNSESC